MTQVVWTQGAPMLHHICIRVLPNQILVAGDFFTFLGWSRMPMVVGWDTGYSAFFDMLNVEGVFLQLTVENLGEPGELSDANHLAIAVPDSAQAEKEISLWCTQNHIDFNSEIVGSGKIMLRLGFLYGAIELVTDRLLEVIFDFENIPLDERFPDPVMA